MTYGAFLIADPLFWSAAAGLSLGVAVAAATRNVKRFRRPERSRSRKWTAAALWATVTVLTTTGGIMIPDGTRFLSLPSLYVGMGAFVFLALAVRFPRAAGIPALLVLAGVAVAGSLVMRSFVPVRETGIAATARLLAADDSGVYIEIDDRSPGAPSLSQVVVLAEPAVVARGQWLDVSAYLFFLGAHGGIVFHSLGVPTGPGEASPIGPGSTVAESPMAEWIIGIVPLLELSPVESEPERLGLLETYQIAGHSDGSFRILLAAAPE